MSLDSNSNNANSKNINQASKLSGQKCFSLINSKAMGNTEVVDCPDGHRRSPHSARVLLW